MSWSRNTSEITDCLKSLSIESNQGRSIKPDTAFQQWSEKTKLIRRKGSTVYLVGNGASASMASHIGADLFKNVHVKTEVFSDLALLTAVANDLSYEEVFAEPLSQCMQKSDMLVAISSSGLSPNVIRACQVALDRGGYVVTLSAMSRCNKLRSLGGHLNFHVLAEEYGLAETCHAAMLHYWVDIIVEEQKIQRAA